MGKLKTLAASLFLLFINCNNLAYANEAVAATVDIGSGNTIIKSGIGVVLGIVILGIVTTLGGWLLDTASKPRHKLYMEIASALIAMLVVIGYFVNVFMKIQSVANMVK